MVSYILLSSRAFSLLLGYHTDSAAWAVTTTFCSKCTGYGDPWQFRERVNENSKSLFPGYLLPSSCYHLLRQVTSILKHTSLHQSSVSPGFSTVCVSPTKPNFLISPGSIGKGSQKFVHIQDLGRSS